MTNMSELSYYTIPTAFAHWIASILEKTVYKELEKSQSAILSCSRFLARVINKFRLNSWNTKCSQDVTCICKNVLSVSHILLVYRICVHRRIAIYKSYWLLLLLVICVILYILQHISVSIIFNNASGISLVCLLLDTVNIVAIYLWTCCINCLQCNSISPQGISVNLHNKCIHMCNIPWGFAVLPSLMKSLVKIALLQCVKLVWIQVCTSSQYSCIFEQSQNMCNTVLSAWLQRVQRGESVNFLQGRNCPVGSSLYNSLYWNHLRHEAFLVLKIISDFLDICISIEVFTAHISSFAYIPISNKTWIYTFCTIFQQTFPRRGITNHKASFQFISIQFLLVILNCSQYTLI